MRRILGSALVAVLLAAAPAWGAADPLRPQLWGLDLINADPAHSVSTGQGAVVAVVDTGVKADHEDLAGQVIAGHDYVDGDDNPADGNGHGTHVAGTIAAIEGNGKGVEGVAPGAKILAIRVLDNDGGGTDQDVAAGIDYARTHGANVINLSLGSDTPIDFLFGSDTGDAMARAIDAGIVVVAAAGNDSAPICGQPPASKNGDFLCVGAVTRDRQEASYSNGFSLSNGVDVVAPGGSGCGTPSCDILSTYNNGSYKAEAGTSMATPHVSGVAALLAACGVRGQAAVKRIASTATDLGPPGPDSSFGDGLVNAQAALAGLDCGAGDGTSGGAGNGGAGDSGSSGGSGGGTGSPAARGLRAVAARVHLTGSGALVGADLGSAGAVVAHRYQRASTALHRAIVIGCLAGASGRCTVTGRAHGHKVARGTRTMRTGHAAGVRIHLTRRGRALLRRARRMTLVLSVRVPRAGTHRVRLIVRR
jgi:subtilisin family serine protease